ncbi:MAG: hypothetical protein HYS22_05755 [Deltaproteobacteria bacterium]|nr:hypothetical protein [Deltaproteobacteria bacterium]
MDLVSPLFLLWVSGATSLATVFLILAASSGVGWVVVLMRLLYFPYLGLLFFAFFWFWAGDEMINLVLVPPSFVGFFYLWKRMVKSRFPARWRALEGILWLGVLSAFSTVIFAVGIHAVLGRPLIIE